MVLRIANDGDLAPVLGNDLPLGYRLARIVRSLCVDVGLERPQHGLDGERVEDRHEVHAFERSDDLGALGCWHHGSAVALEAPHRIVAVDGNDENVAELARTPQVPYVP